jgi:hypothetical protein
VESEESKRQARQSSVWISRVWINLVEETKRYESESEESSESEQSFESREYVESIGPVMQIFLDLRSMVCVSSSARLPLGAGLSNLKRTAAGRRRARSGDLALVLVL